MRDWFEAQLANGLPALAGSEVTGTLALKQELLNELLTAWLSSSNSSPAGASPDLAQLRRFIKTAQVRAESGTVLVDFRVEI